MPGRVRLVLAVVVVLVAVAAILWFTGLVDYLIVGLGLEKYFIDYANVTYVRFSEVEKPYYRCQVEVNSTHVVRTCHAKRTISMIELETRYGRVELYNKDIWRRWSVSNVDYYRVEIADLVNKYYEVYDVANLTPIDLGFYRRLVSKGTFEYKQVNTSFYPRTLPQFFDTYNPSDNVFRFYVTGFTYGDRECNGTICYYEYMPMSMEDIGYYANWGESVWCPVFEEFLGVNCSFTPVDPTQYCTWAEKVKMRRTFGVSEDINFMPGTEDLFVCRKVNGTCIVILIEIPGNYYTYTYGPVMAVYDNEWRIIGASRGFIHEFSHYLGLDDLYLEPLWERSKWVWEEQLIRNSVLDLGDKIALGDALVVVYYAYRAIIRQRPDLKQQVYERLLGYGIDPENETIILPLTKSNLIPPPFSSIIEEGVVDLEYDWIEEKHYGVFNHDIPRVLKAIAQAYRLEKNTTITPQAT